MNIEKEIEKGNFFVSECSSCGIVWPPNETCNKCLGKTDWKKGPTQGILLEFSKNEDGFFGLFELENEIRIIGKINLNDQIPKIGQIFKLEKVSYINGNFHFEFGIR